jgi:outer membrane protein assembly factor BamB
LPSKWQDSDVKWSQQLEGYGQSSPVVFDGKVFITDVIGENKEKLGVHCYDLKTGKKVWSKLFDNKNIQKVSQYISKGSSTPCVDKYGVYCFFETGLLVAISHQGNIKWKRSVTEEYGAFEGNHGVGTSLVQSEGHLVLLIDHSAEGYLLKIDKKTGKNDWKNDREKRVSWSTPVIDTSISPNRIIISSNGIVEAISLKDGKQIWSFNGVQKNTIPSATLGGDLILVGSSEKPSSIALPGNKKGLLSKDQVQWTAENATSSMSSPLVIDGNVYYVNRAGVISCNDIKTGKKFWDHRLPSSCWATPVGVDGLVYFFCKEGSTVIMKNDHEGPSEVFKNKLDIKGPVYGVAVVNNAIIMRTGSRLFSLMN